MQTPAATNCVLGPLLNPMVHSCIRHGMVEQPSIFQAFKYGPNFVEASRNDHLDILNTLYYRPQGPQESYIGVLVHHYRSLSKGWKDLQRSLDELRSRLPRTEREAQRASAGLGVAAVVPQLGPIRLWVLERDLS